MTKQPYAYMWVSPRGFSVWGGFRRRRGRRCHQQKAE